MMLRYPNLSSLRTLNVILFNNGMGGQFLSNLMHLADSGMDLELLQPWIAESMLRPVNQYAADEHHYQMQTTKFVWWGLLLDQPAEVLKINLELFFGDCECRLLASLRDFTRSDDHGYFVLRQSQSRVASIYLSEHIHPGSTDPLQALCKISAFAAQHQINLRYLVCTLDSREHQHWAWQRGQDTTAGTMDYQRWQQDYQLYQACIAHPHAVVLPLSPLLSGDVSGFVDALATLTLDQLHRRDVIEQRARDFYQLKIRPTMLV